MTIPGDLGPPGPSIGAARPPVLLGLLDGSEVRMIIRARNCEALHEGPPLGAWSGAGRR